MLERVIRSTRHPKLPDTFERLRAQAEAEAEERDISDPVQHWLEQTSPSPPPPPSKAHLSSPHSSHIRIRTRESSTLPRPIHSIRQLRLRSRTVSALPLQPTDGNRLRHPPTFPLSTSPPPPTTRLNRKRKMPDSFDPIPRQSARNKKEKNIQSKPGDDGPGVKGKAEVATRVSQRQRKVGGQRKEEDIFSLPGDALAEGEPSDLGEPWPGGGPLANAKGQSNDSVFGKGFVKFPMASSTSSKTPSSPSKRSGSPSKGPIIVNKNERMKFMEPRITFKTLSDTNKSGYLTGTLQKLWQHANWYERRVIPLALKVGL